MNRRRVKDFCKRLIQKIWGGYRRIDNGKNNKLSIGKNTILEKCRIVYNGDNNTIRIGDNIHLKNCAFVLNDDGNNLEMDSNSSFGRDVCITVEEGTSIIIGSGCQISTGVSIRTSDGHSIFDMKERRRINTARSVIIGNKVWIGENAKILKGANIESNCIIGAGSIVTGQILKSNSVYAGVPARKIKGNVEWVAERVNWLC